MRKSTMKRSETPVFRVGELYAHDQIYRCLEVGNAGGIRRSVGAAGKTKRLVLMTSDPSARIARENPYHDRVEGDVLVYTAAGLEGRQELSGTNRCLLGQQGERFPIYGFCNIGNRRDTSLGQKRWRFLGLLQYLRHFWEQQIDSRKQPRDSLVFELLIHTVPPEIVISREQEISAEICRRGVRTLAIDDTEREVATSSPLQETSIAPIYSPIADEIRRRLLGMQPQRFEHMIKEVLEASGFDRVIVTSYTGDGGVDVNALAGSKLWMYRGGLVEVQAKRWLHTVGRREVAELRGSLQPHSHGAVVTTSFYSKAALTEGRDPLKKPIVLINGLEFATIIDALGIGTASI